jgi:hypothetical protein
MIYSVVECSGKSAFAGLSKESITLIIDKGEEDGMRFIAEQVALAKSISERYWRTLEAPDIFWDDDLMRPMAWKEAKKGARKPDGVNIWPLWTIEDAMTWIRDAGHDFLNVYHYPRPEHYEAYFSYGIHHRMVRIDADTLNLVFLTFIDKSLKGEYEEK